MSGRLLRWAGALLATGSALAMTVYLLTVGTDRANPHRPGVGGQESGTGPRSLGSQEPRAGSQEPGAGSRDSGVGSRRTVAAAPFSGYEWKYPDTLSEPTSDKKRPLGCDDLDGGAFPDEALQRVERLVAPPAPG